MQTTRRMRSSSERFRADSRTNQKSQRGMLPGPQPLWTAHSPAVADAPLSAPSTHNGDVMVEAEARNLQKVYGDKRDALVALLSGQLGVLKTEAQAILGLAVPIAPHKRASHGITPDLLTLDGRTMWPGTYSYRFLRRERHQGGRGELSVPGDRHCVHPIGSHHRHAHAGQHSLGDTRPG